VTCCLPFNTYVQAPVEFTIEQGFITDIRGGLDAELLSSYIKSFDDPRGYGMSHVAGAGRARALARADPVRRRHGHGAAQFLRQRDVLHRPEQRARRPTTPPCHFDIPIAATRSTWTTS